MCHAKGMDFRLRRASRMAAFRQVTRDFMVEETAIVRDGRGEQGGNGC